jgi:regulator of cell morphogenesis and NO signaling
MNISPDQTVRDIAIADPSLIRVFERFGIDYCCGGRKPLAQSCQDLQLSLEQVIEKLTEAQGTNLNKEKENWKEAPLASLVSYIVRTHHTRVRQELPRLLALSVKVASKHAGNHPEILKVHELSSKIDEDMSGHLRKEEEILFPYISRLEGDDAEVPSACFPSVAFPISVMVQEHESAGAIMSELRRITSGYQTPPDACPTYRGLYTALLEFEQDLHQHVHLENNILFPRAIEIEKKLKAPAK